MPLVAIIKLEIISTKFVDFIVALVYFKYNATLI